MTDSNPSTDPEKEDSSEAVPQEERGMTDEEAHRVLADMPPVPEEEE